MNNDEIRAFLRGKGAVLVHFSTVMSKHPEKPFPEDLRFAATLSDVPLSFSTILRGDTPPAVQSGGRGGAEGSVGLLVDIQSATSVRSVCHQDSGSSVHGSLGRPPTLDTCRDSIELRNPSNEWHVSDYLTIGVFVLPPIYVRKWTEALGGESLEDYKISIQEVVGTFPDQRVFSVNHSDFLEYDRSRSGWVVIDYDTMLAARW